jgi:predicted regulator of Ras-like GTPase activity (Roadblock/LC7/MglB family)
MNDVLVQLNTVPGVVGSLLCDAEGNLLGRAFPPTFQEAQLRRAAAVVVERTAPLESSLGAVSTTELRFANTRVLVRSVEGARLLLLCSPSVNLAFLNMSTGAALARIKRALNGGTPAGSAAGGALWRAVQHIEARLASRGADRLKLRGRIALQAGFALDVIEPDSPDDPDQLRKLEAAATAVLGR